VNTPLEEFLRRCDDQVQVLLRQLDLLESGDMAPPHTGRAGYVDTTPEVVHALRRSLLEMQQLVAAHLRHGR
jgi:hypothetical protein